MKQEVQEMALFFICSKAQILHPTIAIEASRDTKENFLLELSEFAHADYLLTRDNDLLVLKKWKEAEIILPEHFLSLLRKKNLLD